MANRRAQKSEVHKMTEDASSSPASRAPRRSNSSRSPRVRGPGRSPQPRAAPDRQIRGEIGGGPGASDASSGGGAGAGIPGGGTDMRMGEKIPRDADVEQDRKRLFPEATTRASESSKSPKSAPSKRRRRDDDSDFGGPLDLDRPDATR